MNNLSVIRKSGWFGLAGFTAFLIELVLRILSGSAPLINNAVSQSQFLAANRVMVLTWGLLDMAMYVLFNAFLRWFPPANP